VRPSQIALLLAILLGIVLRCYQLDYSLDGDEIFSVKAASGSFSHVFRTSLADVTHPPLHNLILHGWIRFFGSSEVSVRIPSIVASAVFLLSLHWLTSRISSSFSAFLAVLLCAVSPFFVFHGEEARPYSLAACLALFSACAMLRGLDSPGLRWSLIYGISCAALVYTQYLGVLILLPQFGFIALSESPARRKLLLAGGLGMLSILPWLSLVGMGIVHESATRIRWITRPQAADPLKFFFSIFGYLNLDGSTRVLFLLYVVGIGVLLTKVRSIPLRIVLLLGALATFAPAVTWIVSRFGSFSIWAPRQLVGSAAFFVVLLSSGVGAYPYWVRVPLATVLAAWCLLTVPNEFPSHSRAPWRHIASKLETEPPDTDVVVPEGYLAEPLRYYSNREIHESASYLERPEKARRLVFLCRPSRCEELIRFSDQYRLDSETAIEWVRYGATPTSRLKTYVLEKGR